MKGTCRPPMICARLRAMGMRKNLSHAMALCVLIGSQAFLCAQQKSEADKVLDMEVKLTNAYRDRQVETFAAMLDEDFVITFEDGSTYSKTGYLSYTAAPGAKVEIAEMSDVKVRVHGTTAIVTGAYHERGSSDGDPYDYHERFTDVWIKKNGKWLVVASQYGVPYKP